MNYYKRYRKNQKELECLLENDFTVGDKNKTPVQAREFHVPLMELQDSTKNNVTLSSMNISGSLIEGEILFTENESSFHLTNNQFSGSYRDDFGYLESPQSSDLDLYSVDIGEGDDLGNCMNFVEGDDLGEHIASWAIKHNCTRDCTNDLLKILREKGYNLAKDSRGLLNTSRIVQYKEKCGGSYLYLGITNGIIKILDCLSLEVNEISSSCKY